MKVYVKAHAIEEYLARKNRSKSWLSLKVGISSGYLSQLLDGQRCPSPRMRERFLKSLPDFRFDDLFSLEVPSLTREASK